MIVFDLSVLALFNNSTGTLFESARVRAAKAAFTTPVVVAPWNDPASSDESLQAKLAAVQRIKSFISPTSSMGGKEVRDPDLLNSFTLYKALDRLQALAKTAADKGISDTARVKLNALFQQGLDEIQSFLASATGDKLSFAFARSTSTAETIKLPRADPSYTGSGVAIARGDALIGLAGAEILAIKLTKGGQSHTVSVDLSTITGTLNLDNVASAINAAIAAVPLLDADGAVVTDADGNPVSRYISRMEVTKAADDKWGLSLNTIETESVAFDEATAKNAIVVAAGQTSLDAPTISRVLRFDDPGSVLVQSSLLSIEGIDRDATELTVAQTPAPEPIPGLDQPPPVVFAQTTSNAVAVDDDGFTYVVGTTTGDLGANRSDGDQDLFLTKMDSEGKVVWQRLLGAAGATEGTVIAIDPTGNIVVAGSTRAHLATGDALNGEDSIVVKFNVQGEEIFTTQIDSVGDDRATALAIDASGNIFLGGTINGALPGQTGNGGNDGFVVKLSSTGTIVDRAQIGTAGSDRVRALAIHSDGSLLVATTEDGKARLHKLDAATLDDAAPATTLGSGEVSSIAVDAATGQIAIGGTTSSALVGGTAVGAPSGMSDGFVARLDSGMTVQTVTYLGTSGTDRVDSLAFMDGALYAGGRTNGTLGAARIGATDGFIARLDAANGTIAEVNQFGTMTTRTEPVSIAAVERGASVFGALGLHRGTITAAETDKLVAQTALRAGDSFTIKVGDGRAQKIVIDANETYDTLAAKLRLAGGFRLKASVLKLTTGASLRITAQAGKPIELRSGPDGADALEKLGLEPARLQTVVTNTGTKRPVVQPGGSYSLELSDAYSILDQTDAGYIAGRLDAAIKIVQSGYRSLYWDEFKAQMVDGTGMSGTGSLSPYQSKQLARYQDALRRLGG